MISSKPFLLYLLAGKTVCNPMINQELYLLLLAIQFLFLTHSHDLVQPVLKQLLWPRTRRISATLLRTSTIAGSRVPSFINRVHAHDHCN